MNVRIFTVGALGLALGAMCLAQDSTTPQTGQAPPAGPGQAAGQDGQGRRGFGTGRGMAAMGRGVMGTVTEVASDHFLVKNAANETYTIHYSANTRIMKQPKPAPGSNGQDRGPDRSPDRGPDRGQDRPMMAGGGTPPEPIKASEIKVGDAIAAGGGTHDAPKSVAAASAIQLAPEPPPP